VFGLGSFQAVCYKDRIAVYERDGSDQQKCIQEIAILLDNTITNGRPFSNHLDGRAVDVGTRELPDSQIERLIDAALEDPNAKLILEGPNNDIPRLTRFAEGRPRTTVGPAPDEHLHVSFSPGSPLQIIQPDIVDFPVSMEGTSDSLNTRLNVEQTEAHSLDPPFAMSWEKNPKPSFSDEYYNVCQMIWNPDSNSWIGENPRKYRSLGDPYWDAELKGFVRKLVAQDNNDDELIIPAFGAMPKIKETISSDGKKQIHVWDAGWPDKFTFECTINDQSRSFEIANYSELIK
jgi:hypothetical protein